jgi:cation:H+ antiporter
MKQKNNLLCIGGVDLFQPLDTAVWLAVVVFFLGSAMITGHELTLSLLGACGIVVVMFLVGAAVEVIIETIQDIKGLGTIVGFITNGPETLCLIVGLIAGDVLYAASTPLGSNVMNPLMLIAAGLITRRLLTVFRTYPQYTWICVGFTASLASGFFFVPQQYYPLWVGAALVISGVLFHRRPAEPQLSMGNSALSRWWFIPAAAVLIGAGYFLDPVVSFTAHHSGAPKGVIGFFVLATLTSWPEFKSTLALLTRDKPLAAILNITVSNITNIWLAVAGVLVFLF